MTFQEAMQALEEGKWVRLRWMIEHNNLWFFAHRCSIPPHWLDGRDWANEFFSISIDGSTIEFHPYSHPDGIGATDFSEKERCSDEWEIFERPEGM